MQVWSENEEKWIPGEQTGSLLASGPQAISIDFD